MEGWSRSNCMASDNLFFKQMLLCNLQHRKQQQWPVSTHWVPNNTQVEDGRTTVPLEFSFSDASYEDLTRAMPLQLSSNCKVCAILKQIFQVSLAKATQKNAASWKKNMMKLGFLSVRGCPEVTGITKKHLKGKQTSCSRNHTQANYK